MLTKVHGIVRHRRAHMAVAAAEVDLAGGWAAAAGVEAQAVELHVQPDYVIDSLVDERVRARHTEFSRFIQAIPMRSDAKQHVGSRCTKEMPVAVQHSCELHANVRHGCAQGGGEGGGGLGGGLGGGSGGGGSGGGSARRTSP
jgi:uncharacterized membrane protein YgcG